jgi:hypothetical protein
MADSSGISLSPQVFSGIGSAVSDLFAGLSAETQANLKAQGLQIQAQGTVIQAEGDIAESSNYTSAATLAQQNAEYTEVSTAIQQAQEQRSTMMQIGSQRAAIGGAGLAASGSGLDILRNSAQQGALANAVLGAQGQITALGYQEQAKSYATMAATTTQAASEEYNIANETDTLATETQQAGQQAETGDFLAAAMSGVAAVVSMAPK